MTSRTGRIALLLLVAALVGGCTGAPHSLPPQVVPASGSAIGTTTAASTPPVPSAGAAPDEISGRRWVLIQTVGPAGNVAIPAEVTAALTITNGMAAVQYGCNSGGGPVTVGATTLTFGDMRQTLMACGAPDDTIEHEVENTLAATVRYSVAGDLLTLLGSDGRGLTFTDGPVSGPTTDCSCGPEAVPATLRAHPWSVVTLVQADGHPSSPGVPATITFEPNLVRLTSFCHRGRATISAAADTLRPGPVTMSTGPCPGSALGPNIDWVFFLSGPVHYRLADDGLTLTSSTGLSYRLVPA